MEPLLRKKPEKIMSGTKMGPAMIKANSGDGAAAEMKEPMEIGNCVSKFTVNV